MKKTKKLDMRMTPVDKDFLAELSKQRDEPVSHIITLLIDKLRRKEIEI